MLFSIKEYTGGRVLVSVAWRTEHIRYLRRMHACPHKNSQHPLLRANKMVRTASACIRSTAAKNTAGCVATMLPLDFRMVYILEASQECFRHQDSSVETVGS